VCGRKIYNVGGVGSGFRVYVEMLTIISSLNEDIHTRGCEQVGSPVLAGSGVRHASQESSQWTWNLGDSERGPSQGNVPRYAHHETGTILARD